MYRSSENIVTPRRKAGKVLSVIALAGLMGGLLPAASGTSAYAQSDSRTFNETGKTVKGKFLDYWNKNGGLAQQGFPISGELQEKSDVNGKTYTTQYFERAVFEMHPENSAPYDVLLQLLGRFQYDKKYGKAGAPGQKASTDNATRFAATGHSVGGKFRAYWEKNGGLAQQGYPISDEFTEKSATDGKTYTVQYFERAVFELHPENAAPNDVLLSLLGKFQYDAKTKGESLDYPGLTGNVNLNGAGATFPEPLISKWSQEYNKAYKNVKVNYQGVGSGSGRTQFINKTVDFASSDAPMSDAQFATAGGPENTMHIPWTMGAVVAAYNVPGVTTGIKLTGQVLGDIFLEKIKKWNDPAIASLNAGVTLPATDIVTVHRSDSSGTTNIFTDYLSKASADFKSAIGRADLPTWPGGIGGQGNPGVTQLVKQTAGAIGYVEVGYAKSSNLQYALIKNKAGNFVDGGKGENVAEAADSLINTSIPADLRYSITDAPGTNAYPIAGTNWLLVYVNQADANKGKALAFFAWWATHEGQSFSSDLYYSPLPRSIVERAEAQIKRMQCGSAKCVP
ncbi:MAG: phosphate ABC transporter substrate-binding protein PstS [Chloroflexota bacterium]